MINEKPIASFAEVHRNLDNTLTEKEYKEHLERAMQGLTREQLFDLINRGVQNER